MCENLPRILRPGVEPLDHKFDALSIMLRSHNYVHTLLDTIASDEGDY